MAYTTVTKVVSLFRSLDVQASDTVVTTSELEDMIAEVDAEIDGKLVDHYEVPVTGPSALLVIGKISRLKVAHLIKTILETNSQLSDRDQEVQTNLEKKADKMLNDIIPTWDSSARRWVEPVLQLPDATRKSRSPRNGSMFNSSTHLPTIKKGGDNW